MYELETDSGTVSSVSEGLAAAMAEVLAATHRSSEEDLVEAVTLAMGEVIQFPTNAVA